MLHAKELLRTEYSSVLRRAARDGWLSALVEAHTTPCSIDTAHAIIRALPRLPAQLRVTFRNKRGRARFHNRTRQYSLALPSISGATGGRLRVGIVLHEAAHIWDHQISGSFGHGEKFCRALKHILNTQWRRHLPTTSFKQIFDRHRGPFSIMMTRDLGKKGQASDRLLGPFTAEEAHEEARMLVGDPRENVTSAFVFSETEGQFIGACYSKGTEYKPWQEETTAALDDIVLPSRTHEEDAPGCLQPAGEWLHLGQPAAGIIQDHIYKAPPAAPKPPRKTGSALAATDVDRWPKSAPAQAVLETFTARGPMTPKQAIEVLTPRLVELGVAFPGSLISRLKTAGLLTEAA